jgi:hypothetical protein
MTCIDCPLAIPLIRQTPDQQQHPKFESHRAHGKQQLSAHRQTKARLKQQRDEKQGT